MKISNQRYSPLISQQKTKYNGQNIENTVFFLKIVTAITFIQNPPTICQKKHSLF